MADPKFELEEKNEKLDLTPTQSFAVDEIARTHELPSRNSAFRFALGTALILGYRKENGWEPALWNQKNGKTIPLEPTLVPDVQFGIEGASKWFELYSKDLFALDEIARTHGLASRDSLLEFMLGIALTLGYKKEDGWEPAVQNGNKTIHLDLKPSDLPEKPSGGPVRDPRTSGPSIT